MSSGLFSPFKVRLYLAIWVATLVSNFGMQIHTMAAGWLMLRLDSSPQMVALVQVAASLPYMAFALLAGALSDIYDKRKIMLTAQLFSLAAAMVLAFMTWQGSVSPWSLLFLVMMIAVGAAFFTPTWAASVSSMVPREYLADAVNLNAINFNIGRSFAPALGGMLITVLGIAWAFVLNTLSYLGIIAVLLRWKSEKKDVNADREPVFWAISMGLRYAFRTDYIRVVLARTVLCSVGVGVLWALMPVLAKQHLNGDATTFTIVLTALGVGSVFGGLSVARLRQAMGIQASSMLSQLAMAAACLGIVFSNSVIVVSLLIAILGFFWMIFIPNINVSIQMSSPEWVVGRMLALYQSTIFLSFAAGGVLWGSIAAAYGIPTAFMIAGSVIVVSFVYGFFKPILNLDEVNSENANLPDIDTDSIRTETGNLPIVVTLVYRIDCKDLNEFLDTMSELKSVRLRLGAHNWTLQQEMKNPDMWVERFMSRDWDEQLRRPARYSHDDNRIRLKAEAFDVSGTPDYVYMVIRDPDRPKFSSELESLPPV